MKTLLFHNPTRNDPSARQPKAERRATRVQAAIRPAPPYARASNLPALLGLWPREVDDYTFEGTQEIIKRLRTAIRTERQRGKAASWTYDINRHIRLFNALKHELGFLETISQRARAGAAHPGCGDKAKAGAPNFGPSDVHNPRDLPRLSCPPSG